MKYASRFLLAIFLMFAAGSLAACSEDDPVQDGIEGDGGGRLRQRKRGRKQWR